MKEHLEVFYEIPLQVFRDNRVAPHVKNNEVGVES